MNTKTKARINQSLSFKLKGSVFTLSTLQLLNADLEALSDQLAEKVSSAPNFFENLPVVLDVRAIVDQSHSIKLEDLLSIVRSHALIPIGLRSNSNNKQLTLQAKKLQIPLFADTNKEAVQNTKEIEKAGINNAKIINTPVRSGQQVYARGGDLIILGPVSAGAEVLADGNIHVYGALRGRALAGILGNSKAHIFCAKLEAELLSIAGHYKVSEQLKESLWQQSVNVFINDKTLDIVSL